MVYFIAILIFCTSSIVAFVPPCTLCKNFSLPKDGNIEYGLCKIFKNKFQCDGNEVEMFDYAVHCRQNEKLCGNNAFLFEPIVNNNNNNNINDNDDDKFDKEFEDNMNELNNRCCGEVNETYEIEQLEKEFFELFQKMKKYNKKRIYKTAKDLYKLFRRK